MKERSLMKLNADVLHRLAFKNSQVCLPLAMASKYGYRLFQPIIYFDRFLPLVLNARVAKVESLLKLVANKEFLFQIRTFKNLNEEKHTCSLFQYAVSSYDTALLNCMVVKISPALAKIALNQMDAVSLETSSMKQYFSLDKMIRALQNYITSFDSLNFQQRKDLWINEYGLTQAHAPLALVKQFCDKKNINKDDDTSPKKDDEFYHYSRNEDLTWMPTQDSGIGKSVAVLFDGFAMGCPVGAIDAAKIDLKFLVELNEKLKIQLTVIEKYLVNKVNEIECPNLNGSDKHFNLL